MREHHFSICPEGYVHAICRERERVRQPHYHGSGRGLEAKQVFIWLGLTPHALFIMLRIGGGRRTTTEAVDFRGIWRTASTHASDTPTAIIHCPSVELGQCHLSLRPSVRRWTPCASLRRSVVGTPTRSSTKRMSAMCSSKSSVMW